MWWRYPSGFLEAIIEGRAYAAAKDLVRTMDAKHLPESEWIDRVHEIESGLINAKRKSRRARAE